MTVSGPTPESVQAAVKEIEGLMRTDATPGSGEVSESIPCPAGIVGRIIGRGGETIRGLQQASQAHIVVNQVPPPFHFPSSANTYFWWTEVLSHTITNDLFDGQRGLNTP